MYLAEDLLMLRMRLALIQSLCISGPSRQNTFRHAFRVRWHNAESRLNQIAGPCLQNCSFPGHHAHAVSHG